MIQLIESIEDGMNKALSFLGKRAPEVAVTPTELIRTLPLSENYPCLIDFYITYYRRMRENRTLPTLTYHFCSKRTAKCLVYNKTNRITGMYGGWDRVEGGMSSEDFQEKQRKLNIRRVVIEADGFRDILHGCIENKEPFLLHTEMVMGTQGETQRHQTIVNMENAKSVVYYKKNIKLMGKIDIDELMNIIESPSSQGFRAKISSVWSGEVIKSIRKKVKDEILQV